jgi:hypothetical protein
VTEEAGESESPTLEGGKMESRRGALAVVAVTAAVIAISAELPTGSAAVGVASRFVGGVAQASTNIERAREVRVPLRQLDGRAGCVGPVGGCVSFRDARDGFRSWAVSPDRRSFYGVAESGSVVVLRRDSRTGTLARLPGRRGCANALGHFGCARGRQRAAVGPAVDAAVSPDGRNLYVLTARGGGTAVLTFARERRTGAVRQLAGARGCLSTRRITNCSAAPGLRSTFAVAFETDPDGRTVVAAGPNQIAVYARSARDGALSPLRGTPSCFSFRVVPGCQRITGASEGPYEIDATFAPDGTTVSITYAGWESGVGGDSGTQVTLAREPRTGALTPLAGAAGCLEWGDWEPGASSLADAACTGVPEIEAQLRPPLFLDGQTALIATSSRIGFQASIAMFKRDPASDALLPIRSPGACWGILAPYQLPPTCRSAQGLGWWLTGPVLAPDRRTVYLASGRQLPSSGRVFAFPLSNTTGMLGQPNIAKWRANRIDSYWLRNPWPITLEISHDGRRLFMFTDEPALHTFLLPRSGRVADARHACLGRGPGCRTARGLTITDRHLQQEVLVNSLRREMLVETHDQRFLYLLGSTAAVFRSFRFGRDAPSTYTDTATASHSEQLMSRRLKRP